MFSKAIVRPPAPNFAKALTTVEIKLASLKNLKQIY
jgi:hypothetical protein